MKLLFTISLFALSVQLAHGQVAIWRFNQLDSLQKAEPRDVLVFLKADWCKYCKTMERTVFNTGQVAEVINQNFWFIAFDGESREQITYRGKPYHFKPTGRDTGTHELAQAVGAINGELSYPTLALIKPDGQIVFRYSSFVNKDQMLLLVRELMLY